MKKRFFLLGLTLIIAASMMFTGCQKKAVKLTAESITVNAGDDFSIFVSVDGKDGYENWASMDATLNYDEDIISINDILTSDVTADAMLMNNLHPEKPNTVKLGLASPYDMEFGRAFEIKCTAKKAGEVTLSFSDVKIFIFQIKEDGTPTTLELPYTLEPFTVTVVD